MDNKNFNNVSNIETSINNYSDDKLLSIEEYEKIAKAYSSALKNRGFMIVQINDEESQKLLQEVFFQLFTIKTHLFTLGGFLNTSKFYSLNERQIKKLSILFDFNDKISVERTSRDKTKCLLAFLSTECLLIKNLILLAERCNYESQIRDIINSRLTLLSQILEI